MNQDDQEKIDQGRRHFMVSAFGVLAAIGAFFATLPFISAWWPSARARAAGAPVECDISKLAPGQILTVEWRGKPVWVIRRTQAMLNQLSRNDKKLRDPQSRVDQQPDYAKNSHRSRRPEYLVLIGICTHLGCSPKYRPDLGELGKEWPGGFYCPCHGSSFDLAGRVFKGVPAPINLSVPPHQFIDEHTLLIGTDANNPLTV